MKKIISLILLFILTGFQAQSIELKQIETEEIKLPPLNSIPEIEFSNDTLDDPVYKSYTIKKGTKLELSANSNINDRMKKGSRINFTLQNQIKTKEGDIIPKGTIVRGKIIKSHRPQITANGGLVSIKIDEISYKGTTSRIEAKITEGANKIPLTGNFKGKHTYVKNMKKILANGRKQYRKGKHGAQILFPIPVINLFSIFPLGYGILYCGATYALSPVITLFTKGGSLNIPQGTKFEIKITEDSVI